MSDVFGLRSRWTFVSLVTLVYWAGPQSVRLFYPLHLQVLGASDVVIGLGAGASSIAGLVLAVPSGYLLDRFDSQRVLVASMLCVALTTGAFTLASSVAVTILLMFLQGLFQMWVWLVLQEMMTRVGDGRAADRQLSLFSLAWGVGLAAGPSLGAWVYDAWDFQVLSVSCFLFTLVGTFAALLVPPALKRVEPRTQPPGMAGALRRSFGDSLVVGVMASSFVNIFVQSLRTSFYSIFLERQGVSVGVIGLLLSTIGISSLAVRLVLPALMRRIGPVRPLVWSTWIAVVGVAMTPLSSNLAFLVIGAVMMGSGLGANPPITVRLLAGSEGDDRGVAVGLRMLANRSAQVIQPVVYGNIAAGIGLAAAFPISGVLLGAMTVWMSCRLSRLEGLAGSRALPCACAPARLRPGLRNTVHRPMGVSRALREFRTGLAGRRRRGEVLEGPHGHRPADLLGTDRPRHRGDRAPGALQGGAPGQGRPDLAARRPGHRRGGSRARADRQGARRGRGPPGRLPHRRRRDAQPRTRLRRRDAGGGAGPLPGDRTGGVLGLRSHQEEGRQDPQGVLRLHR